MKLVLAAFALVFFSACSSTPNSGLPTVRTAESLTATVHNHEDYSFTASFPLCPLPGRTSAGVDTGHLDYTVNANVAAFHESDHFASADGVWRADANFNNSFVLNGSISYTSHARFQFFYQGRPFETRDVTIVYRENPDRTISVVKIVNAC